MKKYTIDISGGVGRVICAIPALEAFILKNPNTKILTYIPEIFKGNPLLENKVFPYNHIDIFNNWIKDSSFIYPEPYHNKNYYNQKINLIKAFAEELNVELKSERVNLYSNKSYEDIAIPAINFAKTLGHKHTIVFQPTGSGFNSETQIDTSGRSLSRRNIEELLLYLSSKFNVILMSEDNSFDNPEAWYTPKGFNIEHWNLIIRYSDYFIGCDSVGQHLAKANNVPGSIILGTTFKENVTYPDWFNILDYYSINNLKKPYQPLRILPIEPTIPSNIMDFPKGFLIENIDKHSKNCNIV